MYEALIGTKLTYALEVLFLKHSDYVKLDACYLKGLRQILGMKTTFGQKQDGQDMTNTNFAVVATVERVF